MSDEPDAPENEAPESPETPEKDDPTPYPYFNDEIAERAYSFLLLAGSFERLTPEVHDVTLDMLRRMSLSFHTFEKEGRLSAVKRDAKP